MQDHLEVDHAVFAPKGVRILNMFIDTVVCCILLGLVYLTILLLYKYADMQGLMLWYIEMGAFTKLVIAVFVTGLYYFLMENYTGATIGKFATGSRVVDAYGQRPTSKAILIRTLVRLMPIEVFTFVGEGATGLHDSASNTYVIDIHKYNHALRLKKGLSDRGITQNPFDGLNN
jgi:uncharacterized RDD family membrane protein YckC